MSQFPVELSRGCWMHKPESKSAGSKGGGFMKGLKIGGGWNRRYVWIAANAVQYGKQPNKPEKSVPLSQLKAALPMTAQEVKNEKGPDHLVNNGWRLCSYDKEIVFVTEDPAEKYVWVSALNKFLKTANTFASDDDDDEWEAARRESSPNFAAQAAAQSQSQFVPPPETRNDEHEDEDIDLDAALESDPEADEPTPEKQQKEPNHVVSSGGPSTETSDEAAERRHADEGAAAARRRAEEEEANELALQQERDALLRQEQAREQQEREFRAARAGVESEERNKRAELQEDMDREVWTMQDRHDQGRKEAEVATTKRIAEAKAKHAADQTAERSALEEKEYAERDTVLSAEERLFRSLQETANEERQDAENKAHLRIHKAQEEHLQAQKQERDAIETEELNERASFVERSERTFGGLLEKHQMGMKDARSAAEQRLARELDAHLADQAAKRAEVEEMETLTRSCGVTEEESVHRAEIQFEFTSQRAAAEAAAHQRIADATERQAAIHRSERSTLESEESAERDAADGELNKEFELLCTSEIKARKAAEAATNKRVGEEREHHLLQQRSERNQLESSEATARDRLVAELNAEVALLRDEHAASYQEAERQQNTRIAEERAQHEAKQCDERFAVEGEERKQREKIVVELEKDHKRQRDKFQKSRKTALARETERIAAAKALHETEQRNARGAVEDAERCARDLFAEEYGRSVAHLREKATANFQDATIAMEKRVAAERQQFQEDQREERAALESDALHSRDDMLQDQNEAFASLCKESIDSFEAAQTAANNRIKDASERLAAEQKLARSGLESAEKNDREVAENEEAFEFSQLKEEYLESHREATHRTHERVAGETEVLAMRLKAERDEVQDEENDVRNGLLEAQVKRREALREQFIDDAIESGKRAASREAVEQEEEAARVAAAELAAAAAREAATPQDEPLDEEVQEESSVLEVEEDPSPAAETERHEPAHEATTVSSIENGVPDSSETNHKAADVDVEDDAVTEDEREAEAALQAMILEASQRAKTIQAFVRKGCWMYKPKAGKPGKKKGMFGGNTWNKRFVWVANGAVCYGEKPNRVEKEYPLRDIVTCSTVTHHTAKAEKCPQHLANHVWQLTTRDKTLLFACEAAAHRDSWIEFINPQEDKIRSMSLASNSPQGKAAAVAALAKSSSQQRMSNPSFVSDGFDAIDEDDMQTIRETESNFMQAMEREQRQEQQSPKSEESKRTSSSGDLSTSGSPEAKHPPPPAKQDDNEDDDMDLDAALASNEDEADGSEPQKEPLPTAVTKDSSSREHQRRGSTSATTSPEHCTEDNVENVHKPGAVLEEEPVVAVSASEVAAPCVDDTANAEEEVARQNGGPTAAEIEEALHREEEERYQRDLEAAIAEQTRQMKNAKQLVVNGCWMHKPKSTAHKKSTMLSFGGHTWNKRFVWVANGCINYSDKAGAKKPEKQYRLSELQSTYKLTPHTALDLGCPKNLANASWKMVCCDKTILWGCDTPAHRDAWLMFLNPPAPITAIPRRKRGGTTTSVVVNGNTVVVPEVGLAENESLDETSSEGFDDIDEDDRAAIAVAESKVVFHQQPQDYLDEDDIDLDDALGDEPREASVEEEPAPREPTPPPPTPSPPPPPPLPQYKKRHPTVPLYALQGYMDGVERFCKMDREEGLNGCGVASGEGLCLKTAGRVDTTMMGSVSRLMCSSMGLNRSFGQPANKLSLPFSIVIETEGRSGDTYSFGTLVEGSEDLIFAAINGDQ